MANDNQAPQRPTPPTVVVRALVPDEQGRLLFVFERGPQLWVPPGGRLEYKESAPEAAVREVYEETGLKVEVDDFAFVCEQHLDRLDWHLIQMYFLMKPVNSADLPKEWEDLDQNRAYGMRNAQFMSLFEIETSRDMEPQFIAEWLKGNIKEKFIPYMPKDNWKQLVG